RRRISATCASSLVSQPARRGARSVNLNALAHPWGRGARPCGRPAKDGVHSPLRRTSFPNSPRPIMPKLIITNGADKGRDFDVVDSVTTLGRSVVNGLQIVDRRMSRSHAQICFKGDAYYLEDLKSKNGTQLNGDEVEVPTRLRSG